MSANRSPSSSTPDMTESNTDHRIGDVVVDLERDEENQNRAVVINTPEKTVGEWVAYRRGDEEVTVGDDNPQYNAEAEVVVVAFESHLNEEWSEWGSKTPLSLAEVDEYYAFPPRRLRRVGTIGEKAEDTPADTSEAADAEPDDDYPGLVALSERLGEAADVVVEDGEPMVKVEKLGSTHRISADGEVDNGPMQKQLAEAAAEVLGGESQ